MEQPKNFLCSECRNILKVTNGDYLFSYNTKCRNNHIDENIDLEDLLLKYRTNENLYKCKTHKNKTLIYCYDCNEDICLKCLKDLHKGHKNEYLNTIKLNLIEEFNFNYLLKNEKKMIDIFVEKLEYFLNKLKLFIHFLKVNINNEFKFRDELFNKIKNKKIYSYFDIENANTLLK